ncbi:MAG: toprim domain-containing protein [Methylocella sp.]
MRDVLTNEPRAIQRTRLDPTGRKLDRLMLGPAKGCAIKIDSDADVTMGLCIAEGLETALSGRQLGYLPVWAVGSAGAIATFPVIPSLSGLHVFGEFDERRTSEKAIAECAVRWQAAGRDVHIIWPEVGNDMNDQIRMGVRA